MKKILRALYNKIRFPKAVIPISASISKDSKIAEHVILCNKVFLGNCKIGKYTYIGRKSFFERTEIGAFSSIGPEVICGPGSHPSNFISTYPGFYTSNSSGATWFENSVEFNDRKRVTIGNDVWIGARAIIMGGVKIGNGAIIGAGAVVTKDVTDYAIVGGVPAKLIRYRFDKTIISQLLDSCWWEKSESDLKILAKYIDKPQEYIYNLQLVHGISNK